MKTEHLEISGLSGSSFSESLKIPYEELKNVQALTKKEISGLRIFLVGLFALVWKKNKTLLVLTAEDEIGLEQKYAFFVQEIEKLQPEIYRRMVSARKKKNKQIGQI